MAIRFDPRNVHKQCAYDNIYQEGLSYERGLAIDKKYGKGTAVQLYKLSETIKQWETKLREQLISSCKMGYQVYSQLYNELLKNEDRAYQGGS